MKKLIAIVMCMMMLVGGVALAEGAKPLEGQKLRV